MYKAPVAGRFSSSSTPDSGPSNAEIFLISISGATVAFSAKSLIISNGLLKGKQKLYISSVGSIISRLGSVSNLNDL